MNTLIYSLLLGLIITLFMGPVFLPLLKRLKFGQQIRDDGPNRHLKKVGTPTMGGIMFLTAFVIATLIMAPKTLEIFLLLGVTLFHGFLGFLDDYIKVAMKRSLGLRAKQKLIGQIAVSLILAYVSANFLDGGTGLVIPFTDIVLDFGLGFYLFFVVFIVVGTSNAVNLTDGLDGLAAGITVITAGTFALIAYKLGQADIAIAMIALAGACLGFLAFNFHPAKVFMGDTGSLALGGALATAAVITKTELLLPIIGLVYVVETLSVIIQVISFKLTGKRVFKMSPIHHHFELIGWSEIKVVTVFWFWALVVSLIGYLAV